MVKQAVDYQALSSELDTILFDLQQGELDIDAAMQKYQRGLELVKLLEEYLKTAENRVAKLKLRHPSGDE